LQFLAVSFLTGASPVTTGFRIFDLIVMIQDFFKKTEPEKKYHLEIIIHRNRFKFKKRYRRSPLIC